MNVAELQEALADLPPYYAVEMAGEVVRDSIPTSCVMLVTGVRVAGECYPYVLLTGE